MGKSPVAAGKSSIDLVDRKKVFSILDVRSNSNFLDLACGIGNYSLEVAKGIGEKGRVFAIDLWEGGFEALNIRIQEQKMFK